MPAGTADYSLIIELLLEGGDKIKQLRRDLLDLGKVTQTIGKGLTGAGNIDSAPVRRFTASAEAAAAAQGKAADETLRQAQAFTRLLQAQGQSEQAIKNLESALAKHTGTQLQAVRAQTQLVNLQRDYASSPLIQAVRAQGAAFGQLNNQAAQAARVLGDVSGEARSAEGALEGAGTAADRAGDATARLDGLQSRLASSAHDVNAALKDIGGTQTESGFQRLLTTVGKLVGLLSDASSAIFFFQASRRRSVGSGDLGTSALKDLAEEQLSGDAAVAAQATVRGVLAIRDAIGKVRGVSGDTAPVIQKTVEAAREFGTTASAGFTKAEESAEAFLTRLKVANDRIVAASRAEEDARRVEQLRERAARQSAQAERDRAAAQRAALTGNQKIRERAAAEDRAEVARVQARTRAEAQQQRAARATAEQAGVLDANARKATASLGALARVKQEALFFLRSETGSASLVNTLESLVGVGQRVEGRLRPSLRGIGQSIRAAFSGLREQIEVPVGQVTTKVGGLFDRFKERVGTALGSLSEKGKGAFKDFAIEGGRVAASMALVTGGVLALVVGIGALVVAATLGTAALINIGRRGIEANKQLETLQLGIATVISSVGELRDERGLKLEGIEALNAALPFARDQFQKLRIDALQTAATIAQIGPAFQAAIGPGLQGGLNLDQIRRTTIDITQLVSALGLPLEQVTQEVRAILSADIDNNTQVAKTLGLTKEMVEEAIQQGKLAQLLEERLRGAAAAGALVAQTFSAASSNLEEAAAAFSASVTKGLFDTLRDKLNAIIPRIFDTSKADLISDKFRGLADTLTVIFDTAGTRIGRIFDAVLTTIEDLSSALSFNQQQIADLVFEADRFLGVLADIPSIFSNLLPGAEQIGGELSYWSNFIAETSRELTFLTDLVRLLINLALGGIKLIALGVEVTIQKALGLVGIQIDSLDNSIKRLVQDITDLGVDIDLAFDKTKQISAELDRARERAQFPIIPVTQEDRDREALFRKSLQTDEARAFQRKAINREIASERKLLGDVNAAEQRNLKATKDGVAQEKIRKDAVTQRVQIQSKLARLTRELSEAGGVRLTGPARVPEKKKGGDKEAEKARREADAVRKAQEQVAQAAFAFDESLAQRSASLSKQRIEEEARANEAALEDRAITYEQFYLRKVALEERASELTIAAIRREVDEQERRLTNVGREEQFDLAAAQNERQRDRVRADAQRERLQIGKNIRDLETQIQLTQAQTTERQAEADRQRQRAFQQLRLEIQDAEIDLLNLVGRNFEASILSITRRFRDVIKKATGEFGEDSNEVKILEALAGFQKEQARLQARATDFSRQQAGLDLERARIQGQLNRGVISERQARQEILVIERQRRAELEKTLEAQLRIARDLFGNGSEQVIALEREREALKDLGVDGETAFLRISRAAEDGLEQTLTDLFNATKGLGEAFNDLLLNILSTIGKIAAEEITDFVFNRQPRNADDDTKKSGLAGFLDKILGREQRGEAVAKKTAEAVQRTTEAVVDHEAQTIPRLDRIIQLLQQTNSLEQQQTTQLGNTDAQEGGGLGAFLGQVINIVGGALSKRGEDGGAETSIKILDEEGGVLSSESGQDSFVGKIQNVFTGFTEKLGSLFGGLKNIFGGLISGIGKGLGGLLSGAGGFLGKIGGFLGFADGGYTGGSGKRTPRGVVHAEEFVFRREAVKLYGRQMLERMNAGLYVGGFDTGGFVAATAGSAAPSFTVDAPASQSARQRLTIMNFNDPQDALDAMASSAGEEVFFNHMSRNKNKVRQLLQN